MKISEVINEHFDGEASPIGSISPKSKQKETAADKIAAMQKAMPQPVKRQKLRHK